MISFSIKISIIVFVLLSISTIENKKNIIIRIFKSINNSYFEIVNSQGPKMKFVLKSCGVMLLVLFYVVSFQKCCLVNHRGISVRNIIFSIVTWIIISIIMYFGYGSLLAIFCKPISIIANVKNNKIGIRMMNSFLLLILLAFLSFISENELRENLIFMIIGLVICYIFNIQIMLEIVRNPFCLVKDKDEQSDENRVLIIFSSVLIVLMIILNMYLLVLWTFFSFDGAYTCSSSDVITKWQLLYYTIISFTTVGYGDISPAIFESQVVAVLISITSVMCLIIFVSSVLSVKDDIFGNNKNIKNRMSNRRGNRASNRARNLHLW